MSFAVVSIPGRQNQVRQSLKPLDKIRHRLPRGHEQHQSRQVPTSIDQHYKTRSSKITVGRQRVSLKKPVNNKNNNRKTRRRKKKKSTRSQNIVVSSSEKTTTRAQECRSESPNKRTASRISVRVSDGRVREGQTNNRRADRVQTVPSSLPVAEVEHLRR